MTQESERAVWDLARHEVARMVAAGFSEGTASMAVRRAIGNARAATRGLPDALADEVLVAKLRYELIGCEAWARSWDQAKPAMVAGYRESVRETFGVEPGPQTMAAYERGLDGKPLTDAP